MRIARTLFLLCAVALAAMAFGAGSASAQETPILVENEPAGGGPHTSCAAGCEAHVVGIPNAAWNGASSQLTQHVFGHEEVASRCTEEFTANVFSDGTGEIHDQVLTGPECTRQACDSSAESEWPITEAGELDINEGHMHVEFCLEDAGGGTEIHCDAEVHIDEGPDHHLVFSVNQHCPVFPGVEATVEGSWETEDVDGGGLEITHL